MTDRDLLALANAVGVLDPNTQYLLRLEDIYHHQRRMDYLKGAGTFGALFAVFLLLAFQTGAA